MSKTAHTPQRFSVNFPMMRLDCDENGSLVRYADYEALEKRAADMYEALKKLLACPAIADEDHNDPEWSDPETAEAEREARAALSKASPRTTPAEE